MELYITPLFRQHPHADLRLHEILPSDIEMCWNLVLRKLQSPITACYQWFLQSLWCLGPRRRWSLFYLRSAFFALYRYYLEWSDLLRACIHVLVVVKIQVFISCCVVRVY